MDCALLPSRAEGGGDFTAMAAMACGLPVILSRNTGASDLIGEDTCYPLEHQSPVKSPDGRGTLGWGESDVDEILEALEALYASRELRSRIGVNAARFMQTFTWADHAKALGDVALGATTPGQPQRPLPGPAPPDLTPQAIAHHKAGRLKEAEALYRQIARSGPAPSQGAANYNLGVMLRERGELEEAVAVFRKAATLRPDHARTFNNLGAALESLGRLDEAETSLRRALTLQADYPNALYNLGNVLKATDRPAEAVEVYGRALALQPQDADAWGNAALALQALGRLDEAERHLRRALALRPGDARLHDNLGLLLTACGRLEEALAAHQHALRLDPGFAAVHANLAMVLADLGREAEALASLKRAIAIDPRYAPAHNNLGSLEMERGALDAAEALFEEAIRLKADYADAHWNLGLVRLLQGRFEEGWAGYEWRLRLKGAARSPFAQPAWTGADVSGRTILLLAEQGAGDAIQFIRYAPLLRARGASVSVLAQPALASLFAGADGVDRVIVLGEPLPRFDCHAPLPSLPGLFKTRLDTLPRAVPYLRADAIAVEAWRARLDARPGLKVGLVWRGNPEHSRDRIRSMPPAALARLAATPGIQFFSLQLNASAEELAALGGVRDVTGGLRDWPDTAALVSALDLVISVDTAVAHLAGAMGRPVFLMLPHAPDWRWLLERDDSPWYPSMRLFRQPGRGDWASVANAVREAVAALAS
jgi:tetratricopeptide (TPR) repeat protein